MDGEVMRRTWWVERAMAPWRGLWTWLLWVPGVLLLVALNSALTLAPVGVGVLLLAPVLVLARSLADVYRREINKWTDTRIERPYLPAPEPERGLTGVLHRLRWLVSDPATWRDLLWLAADPLVGAFTAALPALLILYGVWGWLLAGGMADVITVHGGQDWYGFIQIGGPRALDASGEPATAVLGTVLIVAGFLSGPKLLNVYGRWGRVLLGPTEASRLKLRVQHLTETRSDAVDASAAELRRIERDLHDGAQARLVAMGMSLGAIEHLLDKDPEKARVLLAEAREASATALRELRDLVRGIHPPVLADRGLAEAREASATALRELRDLVRGIHPPVLADRGLADAVRALALDLPLKVETDIELAGRPEPPVESAAYFAVSEVLANAVKHSGARRVWLDMRHDGGMLRITITDDGRGGASPENGSGLRGIERRLGTFDGVLALSSPAGGPTIVTMELPCTLT
ncbi:histidine kinase [Actinomadura sp. NBRC 104425]|uniref:sensor histidine kinase n=1 Tax=Actinomadura sp. NBRC 104425 TaxID=3032204 RepID=UPI0024A142CC|nr:histidine kinase [Actinomadura sp. NBRC 104425]GLZ13660.1 histidine kinase [Actinomadura sp. NBRC 104425]